MPETLHPTVCPPLCAPHAQHSCGHQWVPRSQTASQRLLLEHSWPQPSYAGFLWKLTPKQKSECGPLLAMFSEGKSCEGVREGGLDREAARQQGCCYRGSGRSSQKLGSWERFSVTSMEAKPWSCRGMTALATEAARGPGLETAALTGCFPNLRVEPE